MSFRLGTEGLRQGTREGPLDPRQSFVAREQPLCGAPEEIIDLRAEGFGRCLLPGAGQEGPGLLELSLVQSLLRHADQEGLFAVAADRGNMGAEPLAQGLFPLALPFEHRR
ncbi:MAG: hypothetical protein HYY93_07345 [Planctomycetes bacterium]|nr:hypothetical protein [Planctomycetota bacterium]